MKTWFVYLVNATITVAAFANSGEKAKEMIRRKYNNTTDIQYVGDNPKSADDCIAASSVDAFTGFKMAQLFRA